LEAKLPGTQCSLGSRHLRLGLPGCGLLAIDTEHPVSQLGHLLQVGVQSRRIEQDGGLPGGLLQGLSYVFHDQEAVRVLLQLIFKFIIILYDP